MPLPITITTTIMEEMTAMEISDIKKTLCLPHTKVCSLFSGFLDAQKLKAVSYYPILKNWVLISDIKNLRITKQALEKAESYARLAFRQNHSECYGWLLTPRASQDYAVRDVMFSDEQEATYTGVDVSGAGVILSTNDALRKGYRMLGWWHSHSDFEPFQSGIDRGNTRDVINVLALTNYIVETKEENLLEGNLETLVETNGILLKSKDSRKSIFLDINGNFLLDPGSRVNGIRLLHERKVGFCYSLTVNSHGSKPSAQIALQYEKEGREETELVDTDIEIIDDEEMMGGEVRKKLGLEGKGTLIGEIKQRLGL